MFWLRLARSSALFPYTTLFRSVVSAVAVVPSLKLAVMRKVLPATNRVGLGSAAKRRSEEHTLELQAHREVVLRLRREKKTAAAPSTHWVVEGMVSQAPTPSVRR